MKSAAFTVEALGQVVVSFLLLAAAARLLPLEQFGAFAFVTAIAGVQQPIVAFGTQSIAYGRAAAQPQRPPFLAWSAVMVTVGVSVAVFLLTLCGLAAWNVDQAWLYAFAGLRVLGAAALPLTSDAQARHAPNEYIGLRVATLGVAAVAIGAAWVLEAPVEVFAAIYGFEPFMYALFLALGAAQRRRLFRPLRPRYRALIVKAAPIAFQSVMIAIYYRFDQIYIQFRFGEAALALYAAPARLAEVGNMVFGVLVLVVAPWLISDVRSGGRFSPRVIAALLLVILMTLAASGLSLLIGGWTLGLVFGPNFASEADVLAVYVLSTAAVAYGLLASRTLASKGITGIMAIAGLVGAVTNVVAVIILSEYLGTVGAAWGTVVAYAASASILWFTLLVKSQSQNPSRTRTSINRA